MCLSLRTNVFLCSLMYVFSKLATISDNNNQSYFLECYAKTIMLAVNQQTKNMSVYMIECLGGDPMSASKDTSGWNYQYL